MALPPRLPHLSELGEEVARKVVSQPALVQKMEDIGVLAGAALIF